MGSSRFVSNSLMILAFVIPMIGGLLALQSAVSLTVILCLVAVFIWLLIERHDTYDFHEDKLIRATFLTFILGIVICVLVAITRNAHVLNLCIAQAILQIFLYYAM
jgi:hypothetical protein